MSEHTSTHACQVKFTNDDECGYEVRGQIDLQNMYELDMRHYTWCVVLYCGTGSGFGHRVIG